MESSDCGNSKSNDDDKLLKDAIFAGQSLSTSSSEDVQSMIIKVLDDIVVRVSEGDKVSEKNFQSNLEYKRSNSRRSKKGKKKKDDKQNKKNDEEKDETSKTEVQNDQKSIDELKQETEYQKNEDDLNNGKFAEKVAEQKPESVSIQLVEDNHPSLDDQYRDDNELLNRQNTQPDQCNSLLDYYRDPNYWQQSAIIETEHNNISVCEKLIVQSMPNMSNHSNQLKLNQQTNSGVLSVLASRSPSQVNVSEVEKQQRGFADYGHCNELLCKIHARSRIARQLRKKSRRESKQFTLPSGYKVSYASTNAQNRSYKFNKSKHHYQPPVQFQRSLSCSVAVLNSLSLPNKKHSKHRHDDDSSSEDSSDKKSLLSHKRPKLNFHQILTLIVLASLAFASQCSMSIIAPFYPLEAAKKGVTESISGLVFSIHAFTVMVGSPLVGLITPKLGAKRVLLAGILGSSLAIVAFGALDYVKTTTLFIVLCFLVRICEALGSCAFSTVSYIYIMNEFSNDVGWAFGLLETFVGLGMSLGPGIGGGLYGLGGYALPFYLLGVATFLIFPLAWYALDDLTPNDINELNSGKRQNDFDDNMTTTSSSYGSLNDSSFSISNESYQEQLNYWKLIKIPSVLIISLVIIVISQSQGFLDPTIEPHLRTFGIQPWLVGLTFLAMSTAYAFCSPIVGWWASKVKNKFFIMLIGLIITFFGLLLVGPTTIISTNPSIYFSLSGMIIIGIGFATSFIPTFEAILLAAVKQAHYDDNITTYSIVSGYWSSMFALGETIGPIIGGFATEYFSFPSASTIMGIICFCAVILVVVAVFIAEMQNEDTSSIESSSSYSSTDSGSSSFNRKKKNLGDARNYQSCLYGSDEEKEDFNEKSYLLA